MLFYSIEFVVFSAILFILLFLFNGRSKQKVIILLASYIFYMWWNAAFITLIIFSTLLNYFLGQKIYSEQDKSTKKKYLILSLTINLLLLGIFKYFNFFEENLLFLLKYSGYEVSWISYNILLPIGISFYTFETISYNVDLYKGETKPAKSILDFAIFIAFFPRLIAGPILRPKDFIPQLDTFKPFNFQLPLLLLIVKGIFKKVVIADNISTFSDAIFNAPENYSSIIIWLAAIAFAVQIYCDFSGYSDMAIGIAGILGLQFPVNFNRPYFSKTPSEFWKRWHISLSSWLRDYLYISLGGNRKGTFYTYRNLMITMVLGGIWHGASWNFVIWGFLHGLILILYRVVNYDKLLSKFNSWFFNFISCLLFNYLLLITWITFRNVNFDKMKISLSKFIFFDFNFKIQNIGLGSLKFFSTCMMLVLFYMLHSISNSKGGFEVLAPRMSLKIQGLIYIIIGMVFYYFWPLKEAPFIYFQF